MEKNIELNIKLNLQFILAAVIIIAGLVLVFFAFFAIPIGVIDPTVLGAFGEILTFGGCVLGIYYSYRAKVHLRTPERDISYSARDYNENKNDVPE